MPHLKTIVPALILFGFVLTAEVAQADYQNEIGLYTYQTEYEDNDTSEGTALYYRYYFNNVDTSRGPWAEAGFINRAGNIGLSASHTESTFGTTNIEGNGNFIDLTISNPDSPFVFSATYYTENSDYKNSIAYNSETKGQGLYIGYFVQKYTLIAFDRNESKTEYSSLSQPISYESDTNTVSAKTLLLQDNATALSLSAAHSVTKIDSGSEYKSTFLSADYYPNPQLGLGGYISKFSTSSASADGKTYGINTRYFISPKFQLGAFYAQHKPDNSASGTKSEIMQITGSYYF